MTSDRALLYRDKLDMWRWVRRALNGEIVASSTESYVAEHDARENYYRVNGEEPPILVVQREDRA